MRLKLLSFVFVFAGMAHAAPAQQPDIGTDEQVWNAVDIVWKIRGSKKWGERLNATEVSAVNLAFDAVDDWMMTRSAVFFTPQIFRHLFDGSTAQATRIRVLSENDAFAGFDKRAQTINISIGLLQAMYWTQWAVEEARENPALRPHLTEYLYALSRNNYQRTPISASSVIRLTEFVTGRPWRPDINLINQVEARVSESLLGALVFIVAHEGCHAQFGHAATVVENIAIDQEWKADQCAVSKIGGEYFDRFNPYLALGLLALFGLDDQRNMKKATTHPGALCRMSWMIYNNGANGSKASARSIELFPMLVDLSKFPPLTEKQVEAFPKEYRHPNFLAVSRVSSYCGGYEVINPRAFEERRSKAASSR